MRGSARIYDVRMAQFVLRIDKLFHIMGPRASQDLRSPSLIMAPVLIQDGGDRSRKDFWVHFDTLGRTQVLTSPFGIHFIVIQILNTLINLGHGFKKANALI